MTAANYVLVSNGTAIAPDGTGVPNGTGLGVILFDPTHAYNSPTGVSVVLQSTFVADGGVMYVSSLLSNVAYEQGLLQAELGALFNANFDLAVFIRGGNATGITA